MNTDPINFTPREEPSCATELALSLWIWVRERIDPDLANRTTAMIAESNLLAVSVDLQKKKDKITEDHDNLFAKLRDKVRMCKRGATKEERLTNLKKLLPLMQTCKRYRHQKHLADKQTRLLELQINAFETGHFQKQMTDTLRASVVAMKKVGIMDDIDKVDSMMSDLEESVTQQNEISDSMENSLVNSMHDSSNTDDSLMRELMAMMRDLSLIHI